MKKFKIGFSLSELLVALGVIALICTILLPIVKSIMPNQNTVMTKRAYYMIQSVVSELINDPNCYPESAGYTGFDDFNVYESCDITASKDKPANQKFVNLFFDKIGAKYINSSGKPEERENVSKDEWMTTSDGVCWRYQLNGNGFDEKDKSIKLFIDVNKKDKCISDTHYSEKAVSGLTTAAGTNVPDTFIVEIKADGGVEIKDSDWALKAVSLTKNITE